MRGKVERRNEGGSERRRTRTYNALFLVAARFKGKRTLLDISIRGEHAVSRKGASQRDRERDGRCVSRVGGVAFPEGRSREKAAGGCRATEGRRRRKGIEQGGLQFRNGFHSADEPAFPLSSSFLDPPYGFSSSSFLSSRGTQLRWINHVPVFPAVARDGERKRVRGRGRRCKVETERC